MPPNFQKTSYVTQIKSQNLYLCLQSLYNLFLLWTYLTSSLTDLSPEPATFFLVLEQARFLPQKLLNCYSCSLSKCHNSKTLCSNITSLFRPSLTILFKMGNSSPFTICNFSTSFPLPYSIFLHNIYHHLTQHVFYLFISLLPCLAPLLPRTHHESKDFCLFCLILYPQHLE